ncbi:Uncharacterized protein pbN1_07600 [Aromatoleum bremense]|nr:Uncharacterized protein pbN1_07600 [Aromatoleum bremense]
MIGHIHSGTEMHEHGRRAYLDSVRNTMKVDISGAERDTLDGET